MSTTTSFRPYDGREVGSVPDHDTADVEAAVAAASAAAADVALVPPDRRRAWLHAIAAVIEEHADELAKLADDETAKGQDRLLAEIDRAASQLRFYGDVAAEGSWLGVTIDSASGASPRMVRVNQPLGPVAVFGASNFPFAFSVLGNDTASALAAGCPVVVKAHPAHVVLSLRLAELASGALADAGAPEGTFGIVVGQQAGVDLVQAEEIAAVAFTGSEAGGMALWRLANQRDHVIPVFAEMGTVNPVVVTPAAMQDFESIAEGFVASFTLGHGQYCTKPGLMLAPEGHGAAAVVAEALTAAAPSPVMLTEGIASSVETGLAQLAEAGASVVTRHSGPPEGWAAPAAVLTAPIEDLREGSRLLDECFGPVALVVEYGDTQRLRAALAELPGSLVATVVAGGETDPEAPALLSALSRTAGRVTVGDWPTGVALGWAQHHGGPWPATSAPATTSVGAAALDRFVRPTTYQSTPDAWLPPAGQQANPWRVPRRVDGVPER